MKKRARETTVEKRVNINLPAELLKKIDNWRRKQPELPNMSQAVRRLLEQAVDRKETRE